MWPDRVSNPGPLALESEELPNALRGPAIGQRAKQLIPDEAAHDKPSHLDLRCLQV